MKQAVAEVLRLCGRIDAVHNNTGVGSPSFPIHSTTEPEWDHLFRVNVKSVYWTTRFAFPALAESKGTILNTASMVGLIGQSDHAAYVATKGALISLTKAMAVDYTPHSIRVNAICPAAVWTPMLGSWCNEQPDPKATRHFLDTIHLLGPSPQGGCDCRCRGFLLSHRSRFTTDAFCHRRNHDRRVRERVRLFWFLKRKSELAEEIESHLNMAVAERVSRGESPVDAHRAGDASATSPPEEIDERNSVSFLVETPRPRKIRP